MPRAASSGCNRVKGGLDAASVLTLALMGLATPASSQTIPPQNGLEDIVVTARRRVESAQTAPVAVTAIGGQQLKDLATVRLSDVAVLAPSIKITSASGSGNAPVIFIRGIGTITAAMYAEPAVGLYVDGVYMPRPTGNAFDLPDIERLEVLRGPQGTLFGRNTTGGAVLITTATPTDAAGGRIEMGYATNDEVVVSGIIQTGKIGHTDFKAKISGQIHKRDGWVDTPGFDKSDWSGNEKGTNLNFALRGSIGDLTIDNRARYSKVDSFTGWEIIGGTPAAITAYTNAAAANPQGPPFLYGPSPRDLSYRDPRVNGDASIEGYGDVLTLDYKASDALRLKSISAYEVLDENLVGYLGGSSILGRVLNPVVPANPVEPVSVHASPANPGHQTQFSEEFQIAGDIGEFNYLGGLFYYDEHVRETITTILASPAGASFVRVNKSVSYNQETESWAGFGQVGYKPKALDERLEISAGVRYTKDKKDETSQTVQTTTATATTGQSGDKSWDNVGYSGTVSFKVTPRVLAYGRIASSYRAGGFNTIGLAAAPYDPEKAVSYEAGLKSDLLDRHLRLNATVYKTVYDNLQVTQFVSNGAVSTTTISNAAKADYKGFELEAVALIGEHVQLDGNLGYVDPTYKAYTFVVNGTPTDVRSQAHFNFVPNWTSHVGAQVRTSENAWGQLTLRGDYSRKSSADLSGVDQFSPTLKLFKTGRDIDLAARVIWSRIPVGKLALTAQVYGDNLTNHRFINFATDFTTLATVNYNRPRNYGLRVSADF